MNSWQRAKILKVSQSAFDMKSFIVKPESFSRHKAGQHYEVCMPDETVIRKYSVVSPVFTTDELEFGIQLIENGALSSRLWALKEGDELEIRGPVGEDFVWDESHKGPLILIGAGSGITPLLSIYYSYKYFYPEGKCVFILSAKDPSRVLKYDFLKDILVTRFTGAESRIDLDFLRNAMGDMAKDLGTLCYICGPGGFSDEMMALVFKLGISKDRIKSDRFI